MRSPFPFRPPEWTMRRKLFGYMLLQTVLLLLALMSGLILFGRFEGIRQKTYESLDVQMEIFEKDVDFYFDHLAASGIQLSEEVARLLKDHLEESGLTFDEFAASEESIFAVQRQLFDPLRQKLLQESCSGIFVILDASVSDASDPADTRSGLYLQINGYETSYKDILLYRGPSLIAKEHAIMPHRKWKLEFDTDLLQGWSEDIGQTVVSPSARYRFSDPQQLPGTSEKAILLTVPVLGEDDRFYGVCGFEVSESCFMVLLAQPTKIERLTCLLAHGDEETLNATNSLSSGTSEGYHCAPKGSLSVRELGSGLYRFTGDASSYIGIRYPISLAPGDDDRFLAVMIPQSDYNRAAGKNILLNTVLWILLIFFALTCCLYFSKQFLAPILRDLEQVKTSKLTKSRSNLPEIDDLFAFLAEQDRIHEEEMHLLQQEKEAIRSEIDRIQDQYQQVCSEFETAQAKIAHLAYSRKQEVNPEDYRCFLAGIDTLTATERRIFDYYLSGRTVKEIIAIAGIKESTLRYHNQNIYGKLGVNSLKQLLRYAALMGQEGNK